jgi:uncharacterized protein YndB with AHSA1/START domain
MTTRHPDASADRTGAPFVISRTFDAPRELVFAAFTQRKHLERWMGPQGVTMVNCTVDLRPGGAFHYGMQMPNGQVMWGQWIFREIAAPERLVVVVHFSDEHGGVTRHPMATTWPLHTLSTTTLTEAADGKTLMTLHWQALNADAVESQTFDGAHAGMAQGWGGTMNELDKYLAGLQA